MKKRLRKFGSVLFTSALTASIAVLSVGTTVTTTAAVAATENSFQPQAANGVKMPYTSEVGVKAASGKSYSNLRSVPLAYYTYVEYETNDVGTNIITGAQFAGTTNETVSNLIVETAGSIDGWDISSVDDVIDKLTQEDETAKTEASNEFSAAVADKTESWSNTSFGFALTYDSNVDAYVTGRSDYNFTNTAVAGLHVVFSTSGEITPFLMLTSVGDTSNGNTVSVVAYSLGLSEDSPYPYVKGADKGGDLKLRVAALDAGRTAVNNDSISFNNGTYPYNDAVIVIQDSSGETYTAVSGQYGEDGVAIFKGAFDKSQQGTTQSFKILSVTFPVEGDWWSTSARDLMNSGNVTLNTSGDGKITNVRNGPFNWKAIKLRPSAYLGDDEANADGTDNIYGNWTFVFLPRYGDLYFNVNVTDDTSVNLSEASMEDLNPKAGVTITIKASTTWPDYKNGSQWWYEYTDEWWYLGYSTWTATTDETGRAVFENAFNRRWMGSMYDWDSEEGTGASGNIDTPISYNWWHAYDIVSIDTGGELTDDYTSMILLTKGTLANQYSDNRGTLYENGTTYWQFNKENSTMLWYGFEGSDGKHFGQWNLYYYGSADTPGGDSSATLPITGGVAVAIGVTAIALLGIAFVLRRNHSQADIEA